MILMVSDLSFDCAGSFVHDKLCEIVVIIL